ncbi:molybdopterin oxidoreductase family protein [Pseudonocardia spinosispora]|uniref:molybdopterin oxidoreductase family protein n=1 Tax=Pseudonocardia spinosispora TaxID=103441 RepID=UPI000401D0B4|nr:molybdopterin oxidoreductase family protein [Pseudonocardia spinosispora]
MAAPTMIPLHQTRAAATHCPYCALQCGMSVTAPTPGAGGPAIVDPRQFPTNRGGLCQKGWSAGALLDHPERLTTPLLHGTPVDWDRALEYVVDRLAALRSEHGPDSVAVFGSGGLTNEKAYLLGKFARVALGTSQIDYNGRFCMSSAAAAGNRAFGMDRGLPFPVTDLDDAEVVVLAGANVAETMPPLLSHLRGARQVVIDPRYSATARQAVEAGGLHLRPAPGTDLALALGMLHIAVAEGYLDHDYLAARTSGVDAAWRAAAQWWPERAERVTGVSVADQRAVVRMLASARRRYLLTARGVEQHARGVDTVTAWINLSLALGMPGTRGSGFGTITGQGNGQGGREHGQKADQLPGYRRIDDPDARAHVAAVWGVDPASLPGPGRSAVELLDALGRDGGPRAMLVFGSNPVVSAPDARAVAERLESLDLLVVADLFVSETASMADVVLPVAQWAEEEGTMTNLEGRVLRRRRAMPPPPGVRTDLDVLAGLADRLGTAPQGAFPTDPETVFDELRAASAGGPADYSGISYARLDDGDELYWPCPSTDHPGTPRVFLDRFAHPDGLARLVAVDHSGPAEDLDQDHPLWATTGRVLAHYQSGTQTRRVDELAATEPESFVEVHPDTAARAGLADGAWARVISRRGVAVAVVRYTAGIRPDTVFLPFHFAAGQSANLLTNPALDPISRMPEFKVSAVRLEPA